MGTGFEDVIDVWMNEKFFIWDESTVTVILMTLVSYGREATSETAIVFYELLQCGCPY
jgi:hypothetical protein